MFTTIRSRTCLLAALLSPGLAMAESPAPLSQLQATMLASVDALLEHCATHQAKDAPQFQKAAKQFTAGADNEALASWRGSEAYQAARSSAMDALNNASAEDTQQACAQYLPPAPAPATE